MKLLLPLLLSSATSLSWSPKTRNVDSISVDESNAIIVTLPATSTGATIGVNDADMNGVIATLPATSTTGGINVDEVNVDTGMSVEDSYASAVDYYGAGVSVTVDKVTSVATAASASSYGVSTVESSVVVKGASKSECSLYEYLYMLNLVFFSNTCHGIVFASQRNVLVSSRLQRKCYGQ